MRTRKIKRMEMRTINIAKEPTRNRNRTRQRQTKTVKSRNRKRMRKRKRQRKKPGTPAGHPKASIETNTNACK